MTKVQNFSNRDPCLVFDWRNAESVSAAVINAVAAVSGEDPSEMEQLYSVIDTDSLDGVFDSHGIAPPRSDIRVEFSYNGYVVQVSGSGQGFVF